MGLSLNLKLIIIFVICTVHCTVHFTAVIGNIYFKGQSNRRFSAIKIFSSFKPTWATDQWV